ncbi:universal stress protein [bacterium]|nr:universal stress protein [bacterium]MBU1072593.1 universal stress protein [bacterium]MBU1675316.1 universal stress protein [bacterium]
MFRRILCPTDFSEPSRKAIELARSLAVQFGAELRIMHCVEPVTIHGPTIDMGAPSSAFDVAGYQDLILKQAEESLRALGAELSSRELEVSIHLARGKPGEEIAAHAEDFGADLVIIATHGESGWRRFLFGSVAEKVMRTARCPVLTVHEDGGGASVRPPGPAAER